MTANVQSYDVAVVIEALPGSVIQRVLDNADSDVVVVRPDRIVFDIGRDALAALASVSEAYVLGR